MHGIAAVNLLAMLEELGWAGVQLALVEDDPGLSAALLAAGLVDEMVIRVLPTRVEAGSSFRHDEQSVVFPIPPLSLSVIHECDDDTVVLYYTILRR